MFKNVLLPIDLDEETSWHKVLPEVIEYCRKFGSTLHVMTVMPDFRMALVAQYFPADFEEKTRVELKARLHAFVEDKVPGDVTVGRVVVAEGTAYEKIIEAARDIDVDLIVMASHRPAHSDFLLGSNADRVIRHCNRSVLIVRE